MGSYRDGMPSVEGIVRLPSAGRWATVSFVIDTGACATIFAQADVRDHLGIPPSELVQAPSNVWGIGGPADLAQYAGDAELDFEGLDAPMAVTLQTPADSDRPLPFSLLGQDILERFALLAWKARGRVLLLTDAEIRAGLRAVTS
ncbi:MAG: hypothetical protein ACE5R4_08220 [Armatimonadota bacterium]